jgi:predicted DNA-binding protein (MmcQ/YjbR family)
MNALEKSFNELQKLALSYPETREDHPWGESAIKVKGKTFLFMGLSDGKLGLSLKLTDRHEFALQYPFVTPTRYGLGKSGWVTAAFAGKDKPPMDVLAAWLDESYRAIAPKRLAEQTAAPKSSKRAR